MSSNNQGEQQIEENLPVQQDPIEDEKQEDPEDQEVLQNQIQTGQDTEQQELANGTESKTVVRGQLAKKKKKLLKKKKKKPVAAAVKAEEVGTLDEQPERNVQRIKTELQQTQSKSQGKILQTRGMKQEMDDESITTGGKNERAKSLDTRKRTRKIIEDEDLDSQRETQPFGLITENACRWKSGTYSIGKVLGSGMIGVCCLCQDEQNNLLYCLKHMSIDKIREKNLFKNIKEEIMIMYDLIGVKGVCQLEDIIINEDKDVTMVLPFYAHTDLWNFMKVKPGRHLSEKDARTIFAQLVDIFDAIHQRLVMHRDIKPENILVKNDELEVCLADFGLATRNGPFPDYEKTRTGQAGTPCYYCYEIIKKLPYDERCDVWGLGVLLFEMLFGALPFNHARNDPRDYSASISSLKWRYPKSSKVSQEPRDLISKILVPQERRISLSDVRKHPWFSLPLDDETAK